MAPLDREWNFMGRTLVDWAYLVPLQVRQFRKKNPNDRIRIACAVKAVRLHRDEDVAASFSVGASFRWMTARRRALIATDDRLECSDWDIPYASIREAVVTRYRSLFLIDAALLKVAVDDGSHYQFGLVYDPEWLSLPVAVREERLSYGRFLRSLLPRLVIAVAFVFVMNRFVL